MPDLNNIQNSDIDLSDIIKVPETIAMPEDLPPLSVIVPQVLGEDKISLAIEENETPANVAKTILGGLAEEQASLKELRVKFSSTGRDNGSVSIKRGTILKMMLDAEIQRQHLLNNTKDFDVRSDKFKEVFSMFIDIIGETFDQVKIPKEYKIMFFDTLKENMEGWEDKAEKILKALSAKK